MRQTTHYPINIFWDEEDDGCIAEVPTLPGCSAWGSSEADACRGVRDVIVAWVQAVTAAGKTVPVPNGVLQDLTPAFLLLLWGGAAGRDVLMQDLTPSVQSVQRSGMCRCKT